VLWGPNLGVKRLAGIVLILCLHTPVQAEGVVYPGSELLKDCTTKGEEEREAWCFGYIRGVWDALETCGPKTVTLRQVKEAVVRFLRENPQSRHRQAVVLVREAIYERWPCPRPRQPRRPR
jgi:Rap1a immunity proteins